MRKRARRGNNFAAPRKASRCPRFVSPSTCAVGRGSTRTETGIGLDGSAGRGEKVHGSLPPVGAANLSVGVTAVRGTVERVYLRSA